MTTPPKPFIETKFKADSNTTDTTAYYKPIYVLTGVFAAIFIIGPLVVRKGPNRGITRCCIMLTSFCCWIFWLSTYVVQMNPMLGPRLPNHSIAWIGHKWGKSPKDLSSLTEEVKEKI